MGFEFDCISRASSYRDVNIIDFTKGKQFRFNCGFDCTAKVSLWKYVNGLAFWVLGFGFNYITRVSSFQHVTGIDATKGKEKMEIWVFKCTAKESLWKDTNGIHATKCKQFK